MTLVAFLEQETVVAESCSETEAILHVQQRAWHLRACGSLRWGSSYSVSPQGSESMGLTRPPGTPAAGHHGLLFGKSNPNVCPLASGALSACPLPMALCRVQTERHKSAAQRCVLCRVQE